jgi:hypothetical protein
MVGSEHVFGKFMEGRFHGVIFRAILEFAERKYV